MYVNIDSCAVSVHKVSMEKIVSRPKNVDIGKSSRSERIPVQVTKEEKAEIESAANEMGIGASTYIRLKALEAARSDG